MLNSLCVSCRVTPRMVRMLFLRFVQTTSIATFIHGIAWFPEVGRLAHALNAGYRSLDTVLLFPCCVAAVAGVHFRFHYHHLLSETVLTVIAVNQYFVMFILLFFFIKFFADLDLLLCILNLFLGSCDAICECWRRNAI